MEEQLIRYVHDGSETPTDSFVLVANASEMDRQSQPMAFTITILPVNDQPPVLSTNTGLQVSSPPGPPVSASGKRLGSPNSPLCSGDAVLLSFIL